MNYRLDRIDKHISASIEVKKNILKNNDIKEVISEVAKKQIELIQRQRKIVFAGNGGSAADSQHLATEYVSKLSADREPLPALALTTDTSALTAIGNDYGFQKLFARQITALCKEGDMFIGFTTSGNSANIIEAFEVANSLGLTTVGFFGQNPGKCCGLVDYEICVPSGNTALIQECHIMIGHIICDVVEDETFFRN
jgi:D-sedoheptulose 7-phosphate isomerase